MTMENKLIDTGYLKSQITNENQPTKLQKLWEDYLKDRELLDIEIQEMKSEDFEF